MQSAGRQRSACYCSRIGYGFQKNSVRTIPALCAIADEVTKVHAICVKCGNLAYASHRITKSDKRVLLGEKADYEHCAVNVTGKLLRKNKPSNKSTSLCYRRK